MKTQRFLLVAILGTTIWACSRQGEGERCVLSNANADCESGLECTPADKLIDSKLIGDNNPFKTERCCPPDGQTWSDSRCDRRSRTTVNGTGGSSATGGASSSTGGDGSATGGDSAGGGAGSAGEGSSVDSQAGNSSSAGASATAGASA